MLNKYKSYVNSLLWRHQIMVWAGYLAILLSLTGSIFTHRPLEVSLWVIATLGFGFTFGSIIAALIALFYKAKRKNNYTFNLPIKDLIPQLSIQVLAWLMIITSLPLCLAVIWCITCLPSIGLIYIINFTELGKLILMSIAGIGFVFVCFVVTRYIMGSKDIFSKIAIDSIINSIVFFLIYSLMHFGQSNNTTLF